MAGPWSTSSIAAVSRTVRVTARWADMPAFGSALPGPSLTRPRVGFRPTRPVYAAGPRVDPPPSLACAMGTMPDATATAAPLLDPPG